MVQSAPGLSTRLWIRWKSLNLPWRKRRLAGMDLSGVTFWEFKDAIVAGRYRRIAQPPRKIHVSDVQITPQWHQWLRHTRAEPPTVEEQEMDVQRQIQLKDLARLADERWARKPSFLDAPRAPGSEMGQPQPATLPRDKGGYVGDGDGEDGTGVSNLVKNAEEQNAESVSSTTKGKIEKQKRREQQDNPFARQRASNPGDQWQPQSWTPTGKR